MKIFVVLVFTLGLIGICEAAPDLTHVGVSPLVSALTSPIVIRVNVINNSPDPSVACKGNILVDGAVAKVFDIPALAGNATQTTTGANQKVIDLTVPATVGTHTVEINLDSDNQNKESDENNNKATRSVTVKAKLTLRATGPGKVTFPFGPNQTILTCESGQTLAEPFAPGATVTLTAVPQSGSILSGWVVLQGSPAGAMCAERANPCSFVIDKDIFVEAKFNTPPPPPPPAPFTFTVTKGGSGSGTVTDSAGMNCGSDCSSSIASGTGVTVKAQAAPNSTFVNWSNGTGSAAACNNSTVAFCRFTISENSSIRANFQLAQ
jgi:hypothetical protein